MATPTVTKQLAKIQRFVCEGKLDLRIGSAPDVMTAAELSQFLGITKSSLSANLWRYSVPHVRFGRRLLFPREAIHQWLTSRIEERVWIDHYKYPQVNGEYWVREVLDPPPVTERPEDAART